MSESEIVRGLRPPAKRERERYVKTRQSGDQVTASRQSGTCSDMFESETFRCKQPGCGVKTPELRTLFDK